VLHAFTGGNDGSDPNSGLVADTHGSLYGSTFFGGASGQGTIYKLTRTSTGWVETVLHSFTGGADGGNPDNSLLLDKAGNIFGTTISGGSGSGVAFVLRPSSRGYKEAILHTFVMRGPSSGLLIDSQGNFFGETPGGGTADQGSVFELSKTSSGWQYSTIYSFLGSNDGDQPFGGLILDSAGNLYGTTAAGGGPENIGCVFELQRTSSGWTENVLYGFKDTADGANPVAAVVFDGVGNLYGTTSSGGDTACGGGFGCGIVFELSPSNNGTWTKTTLHSFTDNPDGHAPMAGLVFDSAGNLYGTTINGGTSGDGAIFKLTFQSGAWVESVLYSFTNGNDGGFPDTPVIVNSTGIVFGTASFGGQFANGVVFAFQQ